MTDAAQAKPFCINCVSGDVLPGEPRGSLARIGPFDTYVAQPATQAPESDGVAIVYLCDAFGLQLKNNKLLPDMLADGTGLPVYAPDLFHGDGVAADAFKAAPQTAREAAAQTFLQKASASLKMATVAPWFIKHRPGTVVQPITEFLEELRSGKGLKKLGAVGYCYGGKPALAFNTKGLIDVTVACHPSFVDAKTDVAPLKGPTLFNCAEDDFIFGAALREACKKALADRKDAPVHEFILYDNTVHGFAARPKLSEPSVKEAFEKATDRTIEWFKTHLLASSGGAGAAAAPAAAAEAQPSAEAPATLSV